MSRRRTPVGVAGLPAGRHLHYVKGWPWRRYVHALDVCWCTQDARTAYRDTGGTQ